MVIDRNIDLSECKIKLLCKSRGMYDTPELNETLLLHGLCISSIASLVNYTAVATVFLNENTLRSFEGLGQFKILKYLNMNNNLVQEALLDGLLNSLPQLEELHLAGNGLRAVELSIGHEKLRVLNVRKNKLSAIADFSSLASLEVLDISDNCIAQLEFDNVFKNSIPQSLLQLYLRNNEFISKERNYRKKCIVTIPSLVYLDAAAVTPQERELARGFTDGIDEKVIREKHAFARKEARDKIIFDFRKFQAMDPELTQLAREIEFIVS